MNYESTFDLTYIPAIKYAKKIVARHSDTIQNILRPLSLAQPLTKSANQREPTKMTHIMRL